MLREKFSRRTYYIGVVDEVAIEQIKSKYGLSTASDVIRFSLRAVAESPIAHLPKPKRQGKIM